MPGCPSSHPTIEELSLITSLDLSGCEALPEEHQVSLEGVELQEWLSALGNAGKSPARVAKKGGRKKA
jgi:hypothetical protein